MPSKAHHLCVGVAFGLFDLRAECAGPDRLVARPGNGRSYHCRGESDRTKYVGCRYDGGGSYSFTGLPPGDYTVEASALILVLEEPVKINFRSGTQTLNLQLSVLIPEQNITVPENNRAAVSTDANANASAQVLRGEDLDTWATVPRIFRKRCWLGPGHRPDRVAGKFLLTASVADSSRQRIRFAKSGSTKIPFRPNTTSLASAPLAKLLLSFRRSFWRHCSIWDQALGFPAGSGCVVPCPRTNQLRPA